MTAVLSSLIQKSKTSLNLFKIYTNVSGIQVRNFSNNPYPYHDPDGWYFRRFGNREVVGYGINGEPEYVDRVDFPFPSLRFSQPTSEFLVN